MICTMTQYKRSLDYQSNAYHNIFIAYAQHMCEAAAATAANGSSCSWWPDGGSGGGGDVAVVEVVAEVVGVGV